MKNKDFDCVKMKHRAAESVRKDLAGKGISGRLEYWAKQYKAMKREARSAVHA
jgi:hypothetical protein